MRYGRGRGLGLRSGLAIRLAVALGLAGLACLGSGSAAAAGTKIAYLATDIPEAGPLDVWRYDYFVSGRSFLAGEGISILFDETLYGLLHDPPPVDADWDAIVLQPDPLLPDPGRYDAQAKVDAPSLADPFSLFFVWLGKGTPGSQPFEIYDPSFQTLENGETVPVPEPATVVLLAAGLAGLSARARRGRALR